jgi:hypothetical protein
MTCSQGAPWAVTNSRGLGPSVAPRVLDAKAPSGHTRVMSWIPAESRSVWHEHHWVFGVWLVATVAWVGAGVIAVTSGFDTAFLGCLFTSGSLEFIHRGLVRRSGSSALSAPSA